VVVAASYETLSIEAHRRKYDLLHSRQKLNNEEYENGTNHINDIANKSDNVIDTKTNSGGSQTRSRLSRAKRLWDELMRVFDGMDNDMDNRWRIIGCGGGTNSSRAGSCRCIQRQKG